MIRPWTRQVAQVTPVDRIGQVTKAERLGDALLFVGVLRHIREVVGEGVDEAWEGGGW